MFLMNSSVYIYNLKFSLMIFLLVFGISILSQIVFSLSFFTSDSIYLLVFGALQLTFFIVSLIFLFMNFRRKQTTDYRKAFNSFGFMIASGVPALPFMIFGIVYFITGIEALKFIGWGMSFLLFLGILSGIIFGRWNWKIHPVKLTFPHLPESMNGLKIIQISDIHIGSFFNKHHKVQKAIDLINAQQADYVLFTGDLVNNIAAEVDGWERVFQAIKAKKGKYSILGNHDYGDYVPWDNKDEKHANLNRLVQKHRDLGFTPLLNDAIEMAEGLWLLGVENWGRAPFRQSGKLLETLEKVPETAMKILMSHDPTHFDLEIRDTNVDLTLSGHTHGMQFGVDRLGLRWSPVKYYYKRWAGLYQEANQYLYVNRGFGYLGFPGRVGIYPEITVFELTKSSSV